jgi:hypothetical protein
MKNEKQYNVKKLPLPGTCCRFTEVFLKAPANATGIPDRRLFIPAFNEGRLYFFCSETLLPSRPRPVGI